MDCRYCITSKNVLVHELIGLNAKVIESTEKGRIGMNGRIVDETMHTLSIDTAKGEKIIPKREVVLEVELPGGGKALVDGKKIEKRPEERTKELWRKRL